MRCHALLFALGLAACACAQQSTVTVDDFSRPGPLQWTTSMSPDYYKGDTTQKGLQVIADPARGPVLAADVRFVDPTKSEPCFITRNLDQPLPLFRLKTVDFWYKLATSAPSAVLPSPEVRPGRGGGAGDAFLDLTDGFKVRLRTSSTEFNDYTVPKPQVGPWVHCTIDTKGSNLRNVWGKLFGTVKQITFRLDDVDDRNAHFTLLLSDVRFTLTQAVDETYTPKLYPLRPHSDFQVLQIRHAAAGHYGLGEAAATVTGTATTRLFPFKGLHFDLGLYGYPSDIRPLLDTDLIAMVDTDPFILTPQQARDLADLVYSGVGMIFYAGANTLANSREFKRPLADLLPVTFTPEDPQYVSRVARPTGQTCGSFSFPDGPYGIANSVQKLTAKPGALTLLQGDDRPLVVLGEFGKGRVVLINAQPALDGKDDLFSTDAYRLLQQRLMFWVTHREAQYDPAKTPAPRRDDQPLKPARAPNLDFRSFPLITMAGLGASGHYLDEQDIHQDIDRMRDYGFNTIAVGGLSSLAQHGDKPTAADRNVLAIQRLAQGMGLIYEYTSFNLINAKGPTSPCVFSPEYPAALAAKLQPQLDFAKRTPNLLSVKILDEPTVNPKMMDYCEHCRREFQKRYGIPLRPFEAIPADATYERWAFASFMGDYVAEGYRQGYEFKQQSGAKFDLLLTYMSTGLGYERPLSDQEPALKWSKYADRFDFDVYPYFYPASQKLRMVQAAWCMAYARALSRHLGKPWGFYIELDDRNWPFQQNPKEASAECAYEAVLHGANYLNSFIHTTFGTGSDARPERWEWTGRELKKLSALGPQLAKLQRPRAPVAFLYPTAQTYITDQPVPRPYSYACVSSGFGNVDVLPEDVALEQPNLAYRTLILLGCGLLHADMAAKLRAFLADGGTLIVDKLPTRNHRGEALGEWPQGKIVRLDFDLEQAYKGAIEGDNAAAAARLRGQMAKRIATVPNAVVTDTPAQMEVGLRTGSAAALVIVVNHDGKTNQGQVTIRDLGFTPKTATDATTGKPYPVQLKQGTVTFAVKLPARQALVVALR